MTRPIPAPDPPRLVDLHTDWLLQYALETNLYGPELYEHVRGSVPQAEGYLGATSLAVLACFRTEADWTRRSDPWSALGMLLARIEAEFSGRLLIGAEDVRRWHDDPEGLCWGVMGVEGFDWLIRDRDGLAGLGRLFERGVRVFQPIYYRTSPLGGSSEPGDDRGLSELGIAFLAALLELAPEGEGARPILDLAHMNPRTMSDVLDWFEGEESRSRRVLLAYSHGALAHEGFNAPRAITEENLARLRSLGGTIGFGVSPPFYANAEDLYAGIERAAALPFRGQSGHAGIAIGTDFLGVSSTLAGLKNAGEVLEWVGRTFPAEVGRKIVNENAARILTLAAGGVETGKR